MDFIKDNKGKLLVAAAAVGGLLWMQARESSVVDLLNKAFKQFLDQQKKLTEEDAKKESIVKVTKELFSILKNSLSKGKNKLEKEALYIEYFMSSFQIFYKSIKELTDEQQTAELIECFRDLFGAILSIALIGGNLFEKSEENKIDVQDCFRQMILNGEVEEKIDTFDFLFASLYFTREEDVVSFINARVINAEDLKHIFLGKIVRHSHTCLKVVTNPQKKLPGSEFYFSNAYFDMIKEPTFLKTLSSQFLIASLTTFNRYATAFNQNIELFTLKETFLHKWSKMIFSILDNEEYIKNLSAEKESSTILSEIFKQLVHTLFIYTLSYNILDTQLETYSEVFQKRLIPFCSVMILSEEALKSMDSYLRNIQKIGLFNKLKSSFMCLIHDFQLTLAQFYEKNKCSNFYNILTPSITLMITHSHNSIPSSQSIQSFWSSFLLPKDCHLDFLTEPFFKSNVSLFSSVTGLNIYAEAIARFFDEDEQKKIRIFQQIVNNKKCLYSRLRVLGYQYSILQADFEDQEVQQTLAKHLFKIDLKDSRSVPFQLLNVCEKIMTPLSFINQIDIEKDISSQDEKDLIYEQINKYTQEGLQYIINVFKLSTQDLAQTELLIYVKNGIYGKLTLEEISQYLETNSNNTAVLKKDIVLENQMELFFDKQLLFEGFKLTQLNQDMSRIFYDSLDFIKEIQYRFFTKSFFIDYIIKMVFMNPTALIQVHTQALVLYELVIDFIYQSITNNPDNQDTKIDALAQKMCDNKSIFNSLKQESVIFIETHPAAKEITEQLLQRIEARLNQIDQL